jgi:hypothetical protein
MVLVGLTHVQDASAQATWGTVGPDTLITTLQTMQAGGTHYVVGNLIVQAGGVLIIEPGADVRLGGGVKIEVQGGRLTADASAGSAISLDLHTNPAGTHWAGLVFGQSSYASVISNADIKYAGLPAAFPGAPVGSSIVITEGAQVSLTNVRISDSGGNGVEKVSTSPYSGATFSQFVVENCAGDAVILDGPSYVTINSGTQLKTNGGNGVDLRNGARVALDSVTIRDNTGYAIGMDPGSSISSMSNLTVTGNGGGTKDAIGYRGGDLLGTETWTKYTNPYLPWHILGTTIVKDGGHLTIPPGQSIYFAPSAYLDVDANGKITAPGTSSQSIRLTSIQEAISTGPIPAPVISAVGTSASVTVSWQAVAGAADYEVYRKISAAGSWMNQGISSSTNYPDASVEPGKTYLYKVLAVGANGQKSADSNIDLATTVSFTDPVLTAGSTFVKARHIVEVRAAINAICTFAGAGLCASLPYDATALNETALSGTPVLASQFTDMQNRIVSLRTAVGAEPATFEGTASSGGWFLRVYIEDLRKGVN